MFYQNRVIDSSTKVFVYFNLHKRVFSVKALEGEYKGKVVMHSPSLKMKEISFKVNEAGRQRVLSERKKNVHAGVIGYLIDHEDECAVEVTYDPYKYETFVEKETIKSIFFAKAATLSGKQVFVEYEYDLFSI